MTSIKPEDIQKAFLKLVEDNGGFQLALSFRETTVYAGGKGGTVWFVEQGKKRIFWRIGHLVDGVWSDETWERKKGRCEGEAVRGGAEPGSALAHAAELAFRHQEKIDGGRKPMKVLDARVPTVRYNYSFGALAYDIATDFGVTVRFSDVDHEETGYRLESIAVGAEVVPPKVP